MELNNKRSPHTNTVHNSNHHDARRSISGNTSTAISTLLMSNKSANQSNSNNKVRSSKVLSSSSSSSSSVVCGNNGKTNKHNTTTATASSNTTHAYLKKKVVDKTKRVGATNTNTTNAATNTSTTSTPSATTSVTNNNTSTNACANITNASPVLMYQYLSTSPCSAFTLSLNKSKLAQNYLIPIHASDTQPVTTVMTNVPGDEINASLIMEKSELMESGRVSSVSSNQSVEAILSYSAAEVMGSSSSVIPTTTSELLSPPYPIPPPPLAPDNEPTMARLQRIGSFCSSITNTSRSNSVTSPYPVSILIGDSGSSGSMAGKKVPTSPRTQHIVGQKYSLLPAEANLQYNGLHKTVTATITSTNTNTNTGTNIENSNNTNNTNNTNTNRSESVVTIDNSSVISTIYPNDDDDSCGYIRYVYMCICVCVY